MIKKPTSWFVTVLELHWFSLAIFNDVLSVNHTVFQETLPVPLMEGFDATQLSTV